MAYVVFEYIYVLDVSTFSTRVLTDFASSPGDPTWSANGRYRSSLGDPTWSQDGRHVIFEGRDSRRDPSAPFQIFRMNVDTEEVVPLTSENDSRWPTWSPDGQQIAFVSDRGEGRWSIYVMAADGSNQRRIAQPDNTRNVNPAWSPYG